jgi:hypothetical protein
LNKLSAELSEELSRELWRELRGFAASFQW